ncbi:PilZ domain-containing protein [Qipengyuania sp. ASV99]|uniref:PilZ domain-containing protein n=1 Tax=Qipengyuania sp. ASV99 TaxID=3399681 RepID=UPI003A4C5827
MPVKRVIPTMAEDDPQSSHRAAPRLPLSLPGLFLAVTGNQHCILTNLSRTGALIAIEEPLRIGSEGYLRCGPIDHFMVVTRREKGRNALHFDIPVSDAFVFGIRQFQEALAAREQEELLETVRGWTSGEATNHW